MNNKDLERAEQQIREEVAANVAANTPRPPLRVEGGGGSFDNTRLDLKRHANAVKAQINAQADRESQEVKEHHADTMMGIEFDQKATAQNFHNLVGDGETGVDKFLNTGKTDHYQNHGKRVRKATVEGDEPVVGRFTYKVLNEKPAASNEQGENKAHHYLSK